jgi:DNA-directed RNA polymerase specialized sigma24 family protein
MTINAGSFCEDHSQYIGQVYREHYARLHHYFLIQLGDASEADEGVHETIGHLFFFMEERQWEEEAEYIFVYLMRIAGFLCSRKLTEKRSQRSASLDENENNSLFNKVRTGAIRTIKERIEFGKFLLRPAEGN